MNRISKLHVLILVTFVFVTFLFPLSSVAQMKPGPPEEKAILPYDFTSAFYLQHGVRTREIIWRRTGADGLSVFDKPQMAGQRDVRVIVTVPIYNQAGNQVFGTHSVNLRTTVLRATQWASWLCKWQSFYRCTCSRMKNTSLITLLPERDRLL